MRAYLVTFVYTDNRQSFIEFVRMTELEEEALRATLAAAEQAGQITDLYIGPPQTDPTPFHEFYPRILDALELEDKPGRPCATEQRD